MTAAAKRPRLQLRRALRRFLQPERQCLVHARLRDDRWTLTGRVKIRLNVERQFLVAADYSDRHRFSGSQKERSIDDVVRLMDFPVPDSEQNVARLKSWVCRRRAIENLGHFCIGTAFSLQ